MATKSHTLKTTFWVIEVFDQGRWKVESCLNERADRRVMLHLTRDAARAWCKQLFAGHSYRTRVVKCRIQVGGK